MFVRGGGKKNGRKKKKTDTGVDGSDSSGSSEEVGDGARGEKCGREEFGFARDAEEKKRQEGAGGRRPESEGREGNVR